MILRIAIFSVGLGLMIMIVSLNVIAGFENEISKKIFDFWGHISIENTASASSLAKPPLSLDSIALDEIAHLKNIEYEDFDYQSEEWLSRKSVAGIANTIPYITAPGILQSPEGIEGLIMKGISKDIQRHKLRDYLMVGSWFSEHSDRREILLSESTSKRIQRDTGDKIIVHFITEGKEVPKVFYVCGIYKTGLEEFEKSTAITDLGTMQSILDLRADQVSGVDVYLENLQDLEVFTSYINYEVLPSDISATSIKEKIAPIFHWLELTEVNKSIILSLLIAICIINMITAVLILILERKQLIGILKTIGAGNRLIREVFLRYATHILLRALLLGNILGLALCAIQYFFRILPMDEKNYYVSYVPIKFEWLEILGLNLAALLVIVLCLVIPTAIVSRIDPVKVLRFD